MRFVRLVTALAATALAGGTAIAASAVPAAAAAPAGTARAAGNLSATAPGAATPGAATPGAATPSAATPSAATPSAATPSAATPSAATPSAATPSAATPATAPGAATPSAATPGAATPSGATPSGATSSGAAPQAPAGRAGPPAGGFVPVPAFRAVAARSGAPDGPLRHGATLTARVAGRGGVPADAAAVAVTVTADGAATDGRLVVWAAGTPRPDVTTLTVVPGRTVASAGLVRLPPSGRISVYNDSPSGSTAVLVDVTGYYRAGPAVDRPGVLHPVAPARVLDTRDAGTRVWGGQAVTVAVGGRDGVPDTAVGSVSVVLSVLGPTRDGAVIAYADGNDQPTQATFPFGAGADSTQFAVVPTDAEGRITVYNDSSGSFDLAVDVLGYTPRGVAADAGALQTRYPARVVDGLRLAGGETQQVTVGGRGGVPLHGVSALLATLTATDGSGAGSVLAWPAGTVEPRTAGLPYAGAAPASLLVLVPVSRSGAISLHNLGTGSVAVSLDVNGFVAAATLPQPAAGVGRYLGDLTQDVAADQQLMAAHGRADAAGHPSLVLLDVGAQSITGPQLGAADPGVALALTDPAEPTVRLDYAQLRSVVLSYLTGFAAVSQDPVTVAVGTNNSGVFGPTTGPDDAYAATDRGTAWAEQVVDPLNAASPASIVVVGANDIENGGDFDSDLANAQQWEAAYLDATGAKLIYNGSANGCSDSFDDPGATCNEGWTQADFYGLAHGLGPYAGRVEVLPQIYYQSQATQWANIDATGDASGAGGLVFLGALTQYAMDPSSYAPPQGWAALVLALATVRPQPAVPAAVDLTVG